MSTVARPSANGHHSDSRGVVKRRLSWNDVEPFPGNPVYPGRLASMRREWGGYNHAIVGAPAIFDNSSGAFPEYPDDTLFVGDGNHRRKLAEADQQLDVEFVADLYRGLSRKDMFNRRRGLNDRRTVKPAERFIAMVEEGDATRRRLKEAVEACGWLIDYESGPSALSCTNELEWIWKHDRAALAKTLTTYSAAFGLMPEKAQARIIKGIGSFWVKFPEANQERVEMVLSRIAPKKPAPTRAEQLYREGRYVASEFSKYGVSDGIRHRIVWYYNENLKPGKGTKRLVA